MQNVSINYCSNKFSIRFNRPDVSKQSSYENIDRDQEELEMADTIVTEPVRSTERTPLEIARQRRQSMRRLVRQTSTVDTQKTPDGVMQLTYWF